MPGNSFGKNFKITTWGESHGEAIGLVIDGCPAKIKLDLKNIEKEILRRKPQKNSKITTTRREEDNIQILSGVFDGKTTGTPISILVKNKDTRSKDYTNIKDLYRPGHADLTYDLKYGIRDYRGGGRSSGRETLTRVIGGAIAKQILKKKHKTEIFGHTIQVGNIKAEKFQKSYIEKNELRCADPEKHKEMNQYIEKLRFQEGDSSGAIIEIIIQNPPTAIGDPVFDKLDAELAKAMISIGAVKGVEFGIGFKCAELKGSENNDEMKITKNKIKFLSNNAGGILGGISTGENITMRLAIKPVSSISKKQKTITKSGSNTSIQTLGRHDSCQAPRIIPVAEAMAALVVLDYSL